MDEQNLDSNAERQIDELCDQFEGELRAGHRPKIDDYLLRVSLVDRPRLTLELLRMTVEYAGPNPVAVRCKANSANRTKSDTPSSGRADLSTNSQNDSSNTTPELVGSRSSVAEERGIPARIGDFELLEELGSGGMGTVYRARQVSLGRIVALKIIRPDRLPGLSAEQRRSTIERFLRESQAAARRDHPHIVTVYDAGCSESVYYLAMQYVDGGSLADQVRSGPLAASLAATYLEPVCRALHAVHQGRIIHRDLKPSNILIARDSGFPLVGDFGLAKVVDVDEELTVSGDLFGTPSYMSPEQVIHSSRVDITTDVYGIGATLYHLLTGRPPFQSPTVPGTLQQIVSQDPVAPRLLNPGIPVDLETVTLKCLEKDPRHRYSTALAIAQELQRFLAGQPVFARPLRWDQRAWRWCTRHRAVSSLLASLAATLLVFACVSTWLYGNERAARAESDRRLAQSYLERAALADPVPTTGSLPCLVEALQLEEGDSAREFATRVRIGRTLASTPRLERLVVHDAIISDAEFCPNGRYLATADAAGVVQIWSLVDRAKEPMRLCVEAPVTCLRFSPDAKQLAVGSADGRLGIYTIGDVKPQRELAGQSKPIVALDFHPAGNQLASASDDGTVQLWNTLDTTQPPSRIRHSGPVFDLSFGRTGEEFVVACSDGRAHLHSSATGEEVQATETSKGAVKIAKLHPDLPLLLTGGSPQGAILHDLTTRSAIELLSGLAARVLAVDFSRTGELGFVAADTGTILLFRPREQATSPLTIATEPIATASLSPNGHWMLLGHSTPSVAVWQTHPKPRHYATLKSARPIRGLRFTPDSERFLVVADRSVRVFSLEQHDPEYTLAQESPITAARFTQDVKQLGAISGDRTFGLYRFGQDGVTRQAATELELPIKHSTLAPRAGLWAVADDQGLIRFGRIGATGNGELKAEELAPLMALAFDHNGHRLALVGRSGQAWIVDVENSSPTWQGCSLIPAPEWLAFSSDGLSLLAVSRDQTALLQLDSPSLIARTTANKVRVAVAEFTGEGKVVFLGRADGTLAQLDVATGTCKGEPLPVHVVPDKLVVDSTGSLVAAIAERNARVWDFNRRVAISPILEHDSAIVAAAFCHRGQLLATIAADHGVRVWDISTGNLISYWRRSEGTPVACHFDEQSRGLQIIFSDGVLRRHSLHPDLRPIEELRREAERITGLRIDSMGSLVTKP